ncbi:MAG: PEGA domain-containing protein [Deltaproteobacteria bacterium]|nr:PEGA domain-containing protein [Deltaproteobacteria bacterium]
MRRTVLGGLVLWSLWAAAAPVPAWGQPETSDAPGDPAVAAALEAARRHMEAGERLYGEGAFADAAQEFLLANQSRPSSAFIFNVGLCYLQAGDGPSAVRYLRRYVELEPNAPDRGAVEERVREIEAAMEAAPPPPEGAPTPTITITQETAEQTRRQFKSSVNVETEPAGARVFVEDRAGVVVAEGASPMSASVSEGEYVLRIEHADFATERRPIVVEPSVVYVYVFRLGQDEFYGMLRVIADVEGARIFVDVHEEGAAYQTPWQGPVPVGEHRVWVEREGYETAERTVTVETSRPAELRVELERVDWGELELLTNVDGATYEIDGHPAGTLGFGGWGDGIAGAFEVLPAGRHAVTVTAEGMKDYTETLEIGRGQRTKLLVRLNPEPSRVSAWVSFGVAAALFAAGGAFGGVALDLHNDVEDDLAAGRLDNNDPRLFDGLLWSIGADIAFVGGAVLAGLGLYYALRDPLPDSEGRREEPQDFAAIEGWAPSGLPPDEPAVEVSPTLGPTGFGLGLEVRF